MPFLRIRSTIESGQPNKHGAAGDNGKLKVFPDSWGDFSRPDELGKIYTELYRRYPGAWFRRDGRPVVMLMLQGKIPPFAETAEKLFAGIGGRKNVYLVLYGPDRLRKEAPDWFAAADAFTDWLTMSYGESLGELDAFFRTVRESGKAAWAPVMPSFMQSRYPQENGKFIPNLREKLGTTWFRHAWERAIRENAAAVMLATWNDLSEDSSIMPESNHGDAVYELNRIFTERFKTGKWPEPSEEMLFLFHHPQLVENLKLPPGAAPTEGFPVSHGKYFGSERYRRTPPTDYLNVAAVLREPADVTLYIGSRPVATRRMAAGLGFWLVYQPRGLNDEGRRYVCDNSRVYPKSEGNLTVTPVPEPFADGEIYAEVRRNGRRIGFFRSRNAMNGFAGRGDMTMTGDRFRLTPRPEPVPPDRP